MTRVVVVLIVAGLVAIAAGVGMLSPAAGVIVAGVELVAGGVAVDLLSPDDEPELFEQPS